MRRVSVVGACRFDVQGSILSAAAIALTFHNQAMNLTDLPFANGAVSPARLITKSKASYVQ